MPMHQNRRSISRRQILKTSALAGIGLAMPALLRPARAAETTVTFSGWSFEPQVVEANVKVFMRQQPDSRVNYTPLDELKAAALEVKKAGIAQYPILKGFKTNVDGLSEFWSMVFSSGGHLFNEAMDPVFPNEDKTALGVLEWMLEAMHTWQILDPKGLELDETQARDVF